MPTMSADERADSKAAKAILDAARRLFATRTPSAVTLRDVAREAGVNYGLIHRHFRSKDNLLAAVFRESATRTAHAFAAAATVHDAIAVEFAGPPAWGQTLAYALLDGVDPNALVSGHAPAIRVLVERVRDAMDSMRPDELPDRREPIDPRYAVAAAAVLKLGWDLFVPYLAVALPLDDRPIKEVHQEFNRIREAVFEWSLAATLPSSEPRRRRPTPRAAKKPVATRRRSPRSPR